MNSLDSLDVFVLCGGMGTRLRSEIGEAQKVMADINSRPFLDILLEYLENQGFRRVILGIGYKASDIERYVETRKSSLTIVISKEEKPLGTGGAVKYAQKLIKSPRFFALNGDSYCPVNYQKILDFHLTKKALATLVTKEIPESEDTGSVLVGKENRIEGFKEKIKQSTFHLMNVGVYCFENTIFEYMPKEEKFSLEVNFFPSLIKEEFYGFKTEQDFIDIGIPERYKQAQSTLKGDDS